MSRRFLPRSRILTSINRRVVMDRTATTATEAVHRTGVPGKSESCPQSGGDAVRAQVRIGKIRPNFPDKLPRLTANFVTNDAEEIRSTVTLNDSFHGSAANMNLIGDGEQSVSAPSYISAAAMDFTEAEAFYAHQTRFQNDRLNRQGRDTYNRYRDARPQGGLELISHEFYLPGHISPKFPMMLKDLHQVPENYRKLTPEQKNRVQDTAHRRDMAALNLPVEDHKPGVLKKLAEPLQQIRCWAPKTLPLRARGGGTLW